MTRSIVN